VNRHQQAPKNYDYAPAPQNHYANSDPNVMAHQAHQVPHGDAYSANAGDNRHKGAQAGNVAAHAAGHHQKHDQKKGDNREELARIVAEENEAKGKLPRYPGLERWQLIEKMGDGAFSNVYRARDLDGIAGEVAIKVVRKFEMNAAQVSTGETALFFFFLFSQLEICPFANIGAQRRTHTYIRTSRSSQRLLRCALTISSRSMQSG
jgi:hypothetical protein